MPETPPADHSADGAPAATGPAAEAEAAVLLAALVGSRICHDLANPIGAIANGVELLQMGGAAPGSPEMELVADSVAHAAARLRFHRIAYGAPGGGTLGRAETELVLTEAGRGSRFRPVWSVPGEQPRALVRLAFLGLQCLESALPRGGEAEVTEAAGRWRIEARGPRLAADPALWALLAGGPLPAALRPADLQFALAPRAAAALGRRIEGMPGAHAIVMSF